MSRDKEALLAPNSLHRNWLQIGLAVAVAAPAPILRTLMITGLPHPELASGVESAIFGISIFAAATILVWASEVAEQLISATLALALLAIIAVLPEYAVDLYFAWTAPHTPEHAHFALANMTGANRLLVGFAWPTVFFIFWLRQRKTDLPVGDQNALGLVFLGVATLYNFTIPMRHGLSLIDTGVLMSLFAGYLYLSSRSPPVEETELIGPARAIASLPLRLRWAVVAGLFLFSAGTVFSAAEPFANGLVQSGKSLGVDQFVLVQWVAPIASEAPEFLLAALLALRGRAQAGMTLLIAAEVNQWTLLVGTLPAAYAISGTSLSPLPMESRQQAEVFLTAAQSLFAVAILMSLSLNNWEAGIMFGLFAGQLFFPQTEVRWAFGIAYVVLSVRWLVVERRSAPALFGTARRELSMASAPAPPRAPG